VTAASPGRDAYEAYLAAVADVLLPPWDELTSAEYRAWEAVAASRDSVAPELAAAMAETRDVRDGYAALCGEFSDSPQSGQSARISLTVLNRHRERAGLPPRSPAPAGEREDLTMRYRRERDELRAALREAIAHVEPVDQNSELAIARWQELAGQEDPA